MVARFARRNVWSGDQTNLSTFGWASEASPFVSNIKIFLIFHHHIPPPYSTTIFYHHIPPPYSTTIFYHHIPPPYSTIFLLPGFVFKIRCKVVDPERPVAHIKTILSSILNYYSNRKEK